MCEKEERKNKKERRSDLSLVRDEEEKKRENRDVRVSRVIDKINIYIVPSLHSTRTDSFRSPGCLRTGGGEGKQSFARNSLVANQLSRLVSSQHGRLIENTLEVRCFSGARCE